jgi:hypothetical protein
MTKHKRGRSRGGKRQPPAGKPGWYRITSDDLLYSIELRQDLKDEVISLRGCLDAILKKYKISAKDRKAIKNCVDALQSATEPIAFGFGDDNP